MARPEGYRKAVRLMEMAGRFGLPVVTLVDTTGAYPGKGAEERGQSEAIARSTEMSLKIGVPVVSVIIGEGGSGGAVAFATANRVAMLEHAVYSVISPEGCASILWKDAEKMREAAEALRPMFDRRQSLASPELRLEVGLTYSRALSQTGRLTTAVFVLRKTAQEHNHPADRRRVYLAASNLFEEAGELDLAIKALEGRL